MAAEGGGAVDPVWFSEIDAERSLLVVTVGEDGRSVAAEFPGLRSLLAAEVLPAIAIATIAWLSVVSTGWAGRSAVALAVAAIAIRRADAVSRSLQERRLIEALACRASSPRERAAGAEPDEGSTR